MPGKWIFRAAILQFWKENGKTSNVTTYAQVGTIIGNMTTSDTVLLAIAPMKL